MTTSTGNPSYSNQWRDLVPHLFADQQAECEEFERMIPPGREDECAERVALFAYEQAVQNVLGARHADVLPPADAVEVGGWIEDTPGPDYRLVDVGWSRSVNGLAEIYGHSTNLNLEVLQRSDGTVSQYVTVHAEAAYDAAGLDELIRALTEAAEHLRSRVVPIPPPSC